MKRFIYLLVFIMAAVLVACRSEAERPAATIASATVRATATQPRATQVVPTGVAATLGAATATPERPHEWAFATHAGILSTAAVAEDTVYFGSLDYNVYALDVESGSLRWSFETGNQVGASPLVVHDTLCVGSYDGNLYALNAEDGSERWRSAVGLNFSSPTMAGDLIIVGTLTDGIVAVQAADGTTAWTVPTNGPGISSAYVADGTVYIGGGSELLALDATSGAEQWRFNTGGAVQSSPDVAGELVFIGSGDNNLYAIERENGTERWRFPTGGEVISSPCIWEDTLYVGSTDGSVYALDAERGYLRWQFETGQPIISSPAIADGTVYIGSSNGNLYALDATDGTEQWRYDAHEPIWSSPTIADGRIYVGGYGQTVFALHQERPQLAALPVATPLPPQPTPMPAPAEPLAAADGELPWWNDRIFYEVFVRSFNDSDGDGIGDLQGLIDKLDYLNDGDPATTDDLGITGIWLMPIAQSPTYHGYDVSDYKTIESDYGTNADFQRFLEAAHERGIAVIVDLVMNHTSTEHPWFQDSIHPGSPRESWYIWEEMPTFWTNPWGGLAWHQIGLRYFFGMFWEGMPDLNYENGEVTAAMYDVIRFWLEDMEVDGFRLDAVRHLIEDGDVQANTPATHAWLANFHRYVHNLNPNALTVGEVWDHTEAVVPYVGDELNIAFEFDLGSGIISSLLLKHNAPLTNAWKEVLAAYPEGQYAPFLTNHDQDRVLSRLRGDVEAAKVAASLYLTVPGVPFVYYGEEVGMLGAGAHENIRTPMQWDSSETAGFTSSTPWEPLSRNREDADVATQTADPTSLLNHYRVLIQLRNTYPALRTGTMTLVESSSPQVIAYLRQEGDEAVLVLVNLATEPVNDYVLSLGEGPLAAVTATTLLMGDGEAAVPEVDAEGGFAAYTPLPTLPPRSTTILQLLR